MGIETTGARQSSDLRASEEISKRVKWSVTAFIKIFLSSDRALPLYIYPIIFYTSNLSQHNTFHDSAKYPTTIRHTKTPCAYSIANNMYTRSGSSHISTSVFATCYLPPDPLHKVYIVLKRQRSPTADDKVYHVS